MHLSQALRAVERVGEVAVDRAALRCAAARAAPRTGQVQVASVHSAMSAPWRASRKWM